MNSSQKKILQIITMDEANERQPLISKAVMTAKYTDEDNNYADFADDRGSIVVTVTEEDEEELENSKIIACGATREFFSTVGGIALVMIAGFAFTGSNILQKFEVPELTFWQMLMNRAIVQTSLMIVVCIMMHNKYRPEEDYPTMFLGPKGTRFRTAFQGILGGILLCCMFIAVKVVPLGNCSAILFCTPIFTFFLAPCMLNERFGLYRALISAFMVFGVIFITRPDAIFGAAAPKNMTIPTNHGFELEPVWHPDGAPSQYITQLINSQHQEVHNRTFYASPYVPLGSQQHHMNKSTGCGVIVGYVACITVPFLSALISIITRQCNVKKVPVYVLLLWFGFGSSIVAIIG